MLKSEIQEQSHCSPIPRLIYIYRCKAKINIKFVILKNVYLLAISVLGPNIDTHSLVEYPLVSSKFSILSIPSSTCSSEPVAAFSAALRRLALGASPLSSSDSSEKYIYLVHPFSLLQSSVCLKT